MDKILFCKGYGCGKVVKEENNLIEIKLFKNGMILTFPKGSNKYREIYSNNKMKKFLDLSKEVIVKFDNRNWNQRYNDYLKAIREDDKKEQIRIIQDLNSKEKLNIKALSFGERAIQNQINELMEEELNHSSNLIEV